METIVRNVGDLNRGDRSALERVVGHSLGESQRLIIQVMTVERSAPATSPIGTIPDLPEWTDIYAGLSDAEIDELDAAVRERANLSRPTGV
jgi:hypothetical protein